MSLVGLQDEELSLYAGHGLEFSIMTACQKKQ